MATDAADVSSQGKTGSHRRIVKPARLTLSGPRAVNIVRLSTLREIPPCAFCGPPYQPDSTEDDHAQTNPSKYADGDDPRTERHHGYGHGEAARSGVAAVCAITASRIQHAPRAHPDEGDDPDHTSALGKLFDLFNCLPVGAHQPSVRGIAARDPVQAVPSFRVTIRLTSSFRR